MSCNMIPISSLFLIGMIKAVIGNENPFFLTQAEASHTGFTFETPSIVEEFQASKLSSSSVVEKNDFIGILSLH